MTPAWKARIDRWVGMVATIIWWEIGKWVGSHFQWVIK